MKTDGSMGDACSERDSRVARFRGAENRTQFCWLEITLLRSYSVSEDSHNVLSYDFFRKKKNENTKQFIPSLKMSVHTCNYNLNYIQYKIVT